MQKHYLLSGMNNPNAVLQQYACDDFRLEFQSLYFFVCHRPGTGLPASLLITVASVFYGLSRSIGPNAFPSLLRQHRVTESNSSRASDCTTAISLLYLRTN